jgi:hypothetical protein
MAFSVSQAVEKSWQLAVGSKRKLAAVSMQFAVKTTKITDCRNKACGWQ